MCNIIEKMNWIFQKTGKINLYRPNIHKGMQPVRVLHHMNLYMFQNSHPSFSKELTEAFTQNVFSKTLDIVYGNETIKTPCIRKNDKTIELQETFLSYLWSVIHNVYITYLHKIEHPRINKKNGRVIFQIDEEKVEKANELFQYAKSLKTSFYKWDIDYLPNPEKYDAENRDDIEPTNIYYTEAIKFILAHEYIHAIKHIKTQTELTQLEMEIEADYEAIELLKKGIFENNENAFIIQGGIIFGVISLLFLNSSSICQTHPNTEDRLVSAVEQLNVSNDSEIWDYALIGLKHWDEQFNHNFEWNENVSSKEKFYSIIKQVKERNKK